MTKYNSELSCALAGKAEMKPPVKFLASLGIPQDVKTFTVLNDNAMPSKLLTAGA